MWIAMHFGSLVVTMLIDFGSTYNFMDIQLVKTLKLLVDHASTLRVTISNGEVTMNQGHYKRVTWTP